MECLQGICCGVMKIKQLRYKLRLNWCTFLFMEQFTSRVFPKGFVERRWN